MATAVEDEVQLEEGLAGDAVLGWLDEARSVFGWLAADQGTADVATQVERIAALERIKAGAAARRRGGGPVRAVPGSRAAGRRGGLSPAGQGIVDQVGMATRTGPWQGARRLTISQDLWHELPGCRPAGRR